MNGVTKASAPSMVSDSECAQGLSMPTVPWPMATTGQPPGGGVPLGVNTEPETTVGAAVSPDVERYSTSAARRSRASTRRVTPGMVVAVTSEPGPASVRSAVSTGTGGPPEDGKLLTNSRPSGRSEEHTSELQSLMRLSYAVFCLKKKKN